MAYRVTVSLPPEWREPLADLSRKFGLPDAARGRAGGTPALLLHLAARELGRLGELPRHQRWRGDEACCVVPARLVRARAVACFGRDGLADVVGVAVEVLERAERSGELPQGVLDLIAHLTKREREWFSRPWPGEMDPGLEGLGEWLSSLRTAAGLSLRGLARVSGAHVTNVARWEKGKFAPAPSNLRRIRATWPAAPWPPDPWKED